MTTLAILSVSVVSYSAISGAVYRLSSLLGAEEEDAPIIGIMWPIALPAILGEKCVRLIARRPKKDKKKIVTCNICMKKLKKGEYR